MDYSVEGYRLSSQQRRIWSLGGNRPIYRAQCVVQIDGPLAIDTLYTAACSVVARHGILRTSFYQQRERIFPVQVIGDVGIPGWQFVDLSAQSRDQQEQAITALLHSDGVTLLSNGSSLLQLTLLAMASNIHILLISLPALSADAQSLAIFIEELSAQYNHLTDNAAASVHPDADEIVQYLQFSEWQNELLASQDNAEGHAFWRDQHITSWPALHLPFEVRRWSPADIEPASHTVTIPQSLTAAIQACAKEQNLTSGVLLLACWQVLLYRLTEQHDIGIAYIPSERISKDLNTTLGPFSKWLPIRGQLSATSRFQESVQQALVAVQRSKEWQESFVWHDNDKTTDHAFHYPIGFEFVSYPAAQVVGGLTFALVQQHIWLDRFKLKLSCWQIGDTLQLQLQYDPRLFLPESVAELLNQFQTLIKHAVARPQTRVGELALLSEHERQRLLVTLNQTRPTWSEQICIHKVIETQSAKHPERVAVVFEDQQITYAALNARANQIAHRLRQLGVKPDMPVALCVERSLEMIVGMLAILKAGGAYVPLDPKLPQERLFFMLQDTQARIMLTEQRWLAPMPAHQVQVLYLDRDWDTIAAQPVTNPVDSVLPQNLAYVLFTSGSTGTPKGVAIAHQHLHSYVQAVTERLALPDDASYAIVSTFDADLGNTAIFPALCSGGTLHVIAQERVFDPDALAEYFRMQPVDCLKIVPSHLSMLLQGSQPEHILPRRRLVLGGEASAWSLVTKVMEYAPDCIIFNHYGPTETTVGVLTYQVAPSDRRSDAAVLPLGQPLANTMIYLLDAALQPVPTGFPGELYIGGAQVARGYLHQQAMTAERFVPDPFSDSPGARLYRTGDLAYYRPDGTIEFLGRVDHQIKLHGFRIELDEIEAALAKHPLIHEAVVMARENNQGEQQLVAYFTLRKAAAEIPAHLGRTTLPNNLTIAHLNKDETQHLYQQIFVDQIYARHGITFNQDATIFDVGANIGMFTLFVKQVAPGATIYAFEPAPPTVEVFLANAALYAPDTIFFNCGLSDTSAEATYTFYPHASIMSGLYPDQAEETELLRQFVGNRQQSDQPHRALLMSYLDALAEARFQRQTFLCHLRTISEVIAEQQIERIDLLKIDVEKSELAVLRGIQAQDWPKIQQLVVEVHAFEDRLSLIVRMLEDQGFTVIIDQDHPLDKTSIFQIYARREPRHTPESAAPCQGVQHLEAPVSAQLSAAELSIYLKQWLPEYMIPAYFVQLDSLPMTTNGKLDRQALPDLEQQRPLSDRPFVVPRTPAEATLVRIWSDILGVEQIGVYDNFLELGGNSLLAIQVLARAHQAGLQFSPHHFFTHQTIAELTEG